MNTAYFAKDDVLVIHFSDKSISREISQNWNTHISYATDGMISTTIVKAK